MFYKLYVVVFTFFSVFNFYAQERRVFKTEDIILNIPEKWNIRKKQISNKQVTGYIIYSKNNKCKIELFVSQMDAPVPNDLLKQIITLKHRRYLDSSKIQSIKTKSINGFYFSAKNPIWIKKKKLQKYLKKYNTYVVLSFRKYMLNLTIQHDNIKSKEFIEALKIVKNLSMK